MKQLKLLSSIGLAFRIWIITSLILGTGFLFFVGAAAILIIMVAVVVTFPVFITLCWTINYLKRQNLSSREKSGWLVLICFICTLPYGFLIHSFFESSWIPESEILNTLIQSFAASGILFSCSFLTMGIVYKQIIAVFSVSYSSHDLSSQIIYNMESFEQPLVSTPVIAHSNKVLLKAGITGILILVMLIPTFFISNLVSERELRQNDVVSEVTAKWAGSQTLTGPYLCIPYSVKNKDIMGKISTTSKNLILLPEQLNITGKLIPEIRPRSIYKVLLYRSDIIATGSFTLQIPKEIDLSSLQLNDAKICLGISDFKGIEEKLVVKLNGADYEFSPGLPVNNIDSSGLSVGIHLSDADLNKSFGFRLPVKLKGSRQLHFVPLSGNSKFDLQSSWNNPSFDGNKIPDKRNVSEAGFTASWLFNKANLPFGTILKDINFKKNDFVFGVTMVQPADQYAKTSRCVKYALLFIGLTFSLFFIVELRQKKPLHPVQYIMVGIALVVFFTLLLSVSEFILFDYAYLIAAFATVALISFYAKGHFGNWKITGVFAGVLSALYGFIFILVRLEDTALLIGSIGLFTVLALVMYSSRKIKWYGLSTENTDNVLTPQ